MTISLQWNHSVFWCWYTMIIIWMKPCEVKKEVCVSSRSFPGGWNLQLEFVWATSFFSRLEDNDFKNKKAPGHDTEKVDQPKQSSTEHHPRDITQKQKCLLSFHAAHTQFQEWSFIKPEHYPQSRSLVVLMQDRMYLVLLYSMRPSERSDAEQHSEQPFINSA